MNLRAIAGHMGKEGVKPYNDNAIMRQRVLAIEDTFVLEGSVKNGIGNQTVVIDPQAFIFGKGSLNRW